MVKEGGPRRREGGRRERARARYRRVAGALQRKALTALAGQSAGFVRRTGCPVDLTYCTVLPFSTGLAGLRSSFSLALVLCTL